MSHRVQRQFCKRVREKFPDYFHKKNVADVGSLNINGCNIDFFISCNYTGIDIIPGPNVDVVDDLDNYVNKSYLSNMIETFDTIISTECLEHDKHFEITLRRMYYALKPGGLLIITAAGEGRKEHGTHENSPQDSPGTNEYYKNITNGMFSDILPPVHFTTYYINQEKSHKDIQFYGIKS